jgi:hypothetical protein
LLTNYLQREREKERERVRVRGRIDRHASADLADVKKNGYISLPYKEVMRDFREVKNNHSSQFRYFRHLKNKRRQYGKEII